MTSSRVSQMMLLAVACIATSARAADEPRASAAIDWIRAARSGAAAGSVSELSAVIVRECGVQPWEIVLRDQGRRVIRVERSATLDRSRVRCGFTVASNSRFIVANKAERP